MIARVLFGLAACWLVAAVPADAPQRALPRPPAFPAGPGAPLAVRTFGTIRRLTEAGDSAPKVALASILRTPHAYGVGSLSDLRGEIVLLDGAAWLAYPPGARGTGRPKSVVAASDTSETAGFLAVAHVDPAGWRKVTVAESLDAGADTGALEATIRKLAAANGVPADVPFPFRIDGRFVTLTLAVVDGRRLPAGEVSPAAVAAANVLDKLEGVDGSLVGLFAPTPDGAFTHPGTRVHVHAVAPARSASGHAKAFTLAPGATLWLPAGARSPAAAR